MAIEHDIDETTLVLRVPSLTLNKHDIRELCNIVMRAVNNPDSSSRKLIVSGNRESVSTYDIDKLINAKWPEEIRRVNLEAFDDTHFIRVSLNSRYVGSNEIIVSSLDSEWVTARVKEIEDFIAEHRNWHWVFFSIPMLFVTSIVLAFILGYGVGIAFDLPFQNWVMISVFSWMVFVTSTKGLIETYPFVLVESGRSSPKYKLRQFLNWAIPALIAGIVINVCWQFFTHLGD